MAKCKACGAEIKWIETPAGKKMPCDSTPVPYWISKKAKTKIVTEEGRVLSAILDPTIQNPDGQGYVPHWSTCPQAGWFRAGGKGR